MFPLYGLFVSLMLMPSSLFALPLVPLIMPLYFQPCQPKDCTCVRYSTFTLFSPVTTGFAFAVDDAIYASPRADWIFPIA